VEDCGALINPTIVEGQIAGGVAQGIGGVLFERAAYDAAGQLLTSTLVDYLLPTSADIPFIEIQHLESPPQGPVDFRGVGEGGAIGAPAALCNAIADALRPSGAVVLEQHLPPTRILELLGTLPPRCTCVEVAPMCRIFDAGTWSRVRGRRGRGPRRGSCGRSRRGRCARRAPHPGAGRRGGSARCSRVRPRRRARRARASTRSPRPSG
jgi:hypothetical protein